MNTQLATVSPTQLAERLSSARLRATSDGGDYQFIKMRKDGVWQYGADEIIVEEGSQWALHPNTFMEGFIAWNNNEVQGEEMKSMLDGAPLLVSDLPQVSGDGWNKQLSVLMVCISGGDEGTQVLLKTSSAGGKKELGRVIGEVIAQLAVSPEEYMPIVELGSDSYKHKKYGMIYTPELEILDWFKLDDVDFDSDSEEADDEEEEEAEVVEPVAEKAEPAKKRTRRVRK